MPKPHSKMPGTAAHPGSPNIAVFARDVHMWFFDANPVTRALQGIDLIIRRGEVFGLLGPEGSGKSTTLRLLAGLFAPTDGTIRVFGRPPRRRSARARTGYVPQNLDPERARS